MDFRFNGEVATETATLSVEFLRNNNNNNNNGLLILISPFKSFNYSDMCYAKQKPTPKKFNSFPIQRTWQT
jgi:hypothetical protein